MPWSPFLPVFPARLGLGGGCGVRTPPPVIELPSNQTGCWGLSEGAHTVWPCEGTRAVLAGGQAGVGGAPSGGAQLALLP